MERYEIAKLEYPLRKVEVERRKVLVLELPKVSLSLVPEVI